jgi:hypothetical protein
MHAEEMKNRVMPIITKIFKIFASEDEVDILLRNVERFSVECHDYVQGNSDEYASPEQASAAFVLKWLEAIRTGLPNLSKNAKDLLEYLVEYVISIGTTMIYSSAEPLHLSDLILFFEEALEEADMSICASTNVDFCKKARMSAVVTSACDTIPYAVYPAMKAQADLAQTNSLAHLEMYNNLRPHNFDRFAGKPIIRSFFENETYKFQPYFKNVDIKYSYQACLAGMIPKGGMRTEVSRNIDKEQAAAASFGDFLRRCQRAHKNHESFESFLEFFEKEFERTHIFEAIEKLFFDRNKIDDEINFCNGQIAKAETAKFEIEAYFDYLEEKKQSAKSSNQDVSVSAVARTSGVSQASTTVTQYPVVVEPDAVRADAKNLDSLFKFYQELSLIEKKRFLQEISLNMILQAGAIYIQQPILDNESEPGSIVGTPRNQAPLRAGSLVPGVSKIFEVSELSSRSIYSEGNSTSRTNERRRKSRAESLTAEAQTDQEKAPSPPRSAGFFAKSDAGSNDNSRSNRSNIYPEIAVEVDEIDALDDCVNHVPFQIKN